jgi:hypothetical protein
MIERMRRRLLAFAIATVAALGSAGAAVAHLAVDPPFLAVAGKQRFVLTVHNDRDQPMTGFRLTVPEGLRIIGTGGGSGWNETVEGAVASFGGRTLAPDTPVDFEVDLEAASVEPGTVELTGDQLYAADDESVSWPVSLTIIPEGATAPPDENGAFSGTSIAILGVLGFVVLASFGAVLWQRRRAGSLQEK